MNNILYSRIKTFKNRVNQSDQRFECNGNKTKDSLFERGVAQDSSLSPLLFNLCIAFVLRYIYGFELDLGLKKLFVSAFADDIAIILNDVKSGSSLLNVVITLLFEIDLTINLSKSQTMEGAKGNFNTA